jgi:hypothetical protein
MPKIVSYGNPSIHFSYNSKDKSWRLKEKIVAIIESYLQGREDILTFSSVKVTDIVGDPEELDIAYASMNEPNDYFSFVEVRNRGSVVQRNYIQEIIGKKESIDIKSCKIVSTKGFSKNAIRMASHVGIPLMILLPETEENIKLWFKPEIIHVRFPITKLVRCFIKATNKNKEYDLHYYYTREKTDNEGNLHFEEFPDVDMVSNRWRFLVPIEKSNEYKTITFSKVFEIEYLNKSRYRAELEAKTPADNVFHTNKHSLKFEPGLVYVEYESNKESELLNVLSIEFFFLVNLNQKDAPIVERYKYINAVSKEIIADVLLASYEKSLEHYYVCLVRLRNADKSYRLGGAHFW